MLSVLSKHSKLNEVKRERMSEHKGERELLLAAKIDRNVSFVSQI